jgi:hypothetical protein
MGLVLFRLCRHDAFWRSCQNNFFYFLGHYSFWHLDTDFFFTKTTMAFQIAIKSGVRKVQNTKPEKIYLQISIHKEGNIGDIRVIRLN